MIKNFKCKETQKIFNGSFSKKLPHDTQKIAFRKLLMLNASLHLSDLKIPPNNKLEGITNDRKGQYSIRINDQFRICFYWVDNDAENVEIVDYH